MPLLRHLDLQLSDPATDVLATFRDVPLLRSVILNDFVCISSYRGAIDVPNFVLVYPHECVPVLQKTVNLVHCELEICFDYDNDEPGPTAFLGTFIVPALRSLKIPEDLIGPNPIDSLTGFISKSGCKLEEVHIAGPCSLPPDSYRQAFPSIRKFSFPGTKRRRR
ncbi:hypothetical protein B0H13DRAFT_1032220 [Mycena leptocephala]|nr:hypothetical protein B0H13DRAFT_1032220 [Mycena leptocephala]